MGLAVRDTIPSAVRTAVDLAVKGKAEARVERLKMEVESPKTQVVERD